MKIGTRVFVWNADQSEAIGYGRYEGEQMCRGLIVLTADKGPVLYTHKDDPTREIPIPPGVPPERCDRFEGMTPVIRLDSGEAVLGSQTWWAPVDEKLEPVE